jgi:hypothetical protein
MSEQVPRDEISRGGIRGENGSISNFQPSKTDDGKSPDLSLN